MDKVLNRNLFLSIRDTIRKILEKLGPGLTNHPG